jgi:hypothetical protein
MQDGRNPPRLRELHRAVSRDPHRAGLLRWRVTGDLGAWRHTGATPAGRRLQPVRRRGHLLRPGCAEHVYWEAPPPPSGRRPVRTRVVVDVISGTSAGVNGVLAKAITHSLPQESLHNPWLTDAEIGRLLAGPSFLLPRGKLHEALPGIVALMPNGHVLPEAPDAADAMVVSGGLVSNGRRWRFRAVRRWWYEPSDGAGLNTTMLELDADPDTVTPVPLARRLPNVAAKDCPRTDLIGRSRGLEQPQSSLQHNRLRDYDDRLLHYRSLVSRAALAVHLRRRLAAHRCPARWGFDQPRLRKKDGSTRPAKRSRDRRSRPTFTRPPVPDRPTRDGGPR